MKVFDEIGPWLACLGMGRYADSFERNGIDLRALAYLRDEQLKELGVSADHRPVLLEAAAAFWQDGEGPEDPGPQARRAEEGPAEQRQVTVLSCDLLEPTGLARDAQGADEIASRLRDVAANAVTRYGGYVGECPAGTVCAYFGWPRAYEDQAERAVRAGLEAVAAVDSLQDRGVDTLRPRVGIATGDAVVGHLSGETDSVVGTVTSEIPERAAALLRMAEAGQVVISGSTRQLLGKTFALAELEENRTEGAADRADAWAVTGEGAAESRFEAAHGGTLVRLVGREKELSVLRQRWDLAKNGQGQIVLMSGEAGIGKSRMLQDFARSIAGEKHINIHYQCSPHHTNSAFHPVIQRLRRAAGIADDDAESVKLDKLEDLLVPTGGNDPAVLPLFAALLSLSGEDRLGPLDLTPQQLRHRTIEALIDQLLALTERKPLLLVVEDAHWIDPSMSDYVAEILPRIAGRTAYVLVTYRPEFVPTWPNHDHQSCVALNRLEQFHAAEIARAVGGGGLMDGVVDGIVARAEGVPLYVEELTKSVIESHLSGGDTGGETAIPPTLQSSLVARLDRLGSAKDVAQVGAVLGREFSHDWLAAVTNKTYGDVSDSLERLVQAGLLFRRGHDQETLYTFKHALVQDAAYNTILEDRRRQLHELILGYLEAQSLSQPGEKVDLLAHHAFQGEAWDKAFAYAQQAGSRAMDRAAIREAVAHFERALAAGSYLPETRESLERAIDLRFELRNALWSIGAFEEILTNLQDAEALAEKLGDPARTGWISVFRSASFWQLGQSELARASAKNALLVNRDPQDLSLEIGANFYLGCALVTSGDCRGAEVYFHKVVDPLEGELSHQRCGLPFVPAVVGRSWLVWALAERGEFEEAARHGEVALQIAKEVGHPFNLAHIYYDLGYFYAVKGDFDRAVETLESAYALIREWSLTYLSPFIMGFLGHACALAGDTEKGVALLRQAVSDYESMGLGLFRSLVAVQLGEALFLSGDIEAAREATERAVALTRKREEQGHEAYGLRLLGEIALRSDPPDGDAAKKHFEKALGIAEAHGMRPLIAHCHFGLGRVYAQQGRDQDAEESLERAMALYRDLDMQPWLQDAEAQSKKGTE